MGSEFKCLWPHGTRVDEETIEIPVRGETVKFALTQTEVEETFSIPEYELDSPIFYLVDNLDRGGVFYDMGAHIGSYSTVVGTLRPDVQVVAFEPHPKVREKLEENLAVNDVDADVYGYGMGGTNTVGSWAPTGSAKCMAGVSVESNGERSHDQSLPVRTLDRVVDEENLPLPTMLKLDIEGHEVGLLRNSDRVLSRESVKQLNVEVHPRQIKNRGEDPSEIIDLLESYGFEVFSAHEVEQKDNVFKIDAWRDKTAPKSEKVMSTENRNNPDEQNVKHT